MDFADILAQWEQRRGSDQVPDHLEEEREPARTGLGRRALKKMRPQDELDLHGLYEREALEALKRFISRSRERGLKKVLVIHGKGRHSAQTPVLGRAVRKFLESCPQAGDFGTASREDGGQGAVWVILR
jgi:DNA-nicking Smr family endonuclease